MNDNELTQELIDIVENDCLSNEQVLSLLTAYYKRDSTKANIRLSDYKLNIIKSIGELSEVLPSSERKIYLNGSELVINNLQFTNDTAAAFDFEMFSLTSNLTLANIKAKTYLVAAGQATNSYTVTKAVSDQVLMTNNRATTIEQTSIKAPTIVTKKVK